MTTVPSNLVPTRISQLTEYLGTSTEGYLPYVLNGVTYKVQFSNIAAVGAVPSSRTITGGDGLAGGGDLSTNRVIYLADGGVTYNKLADSGVTAGTYGSASTIPVLSVDAKGRVTGASTVNINLNDYVPTSRAIIAGPGLTGGGTLTTDRTISLALTAAEPQPLGVPTAGSSTFAARDDHVHPAVNLTDTTETSGVLPMSRGGTGSALTPAAGAILYTTGSETTLSNAGSSGQFFVSGGTAGPSWFNVTGGSTGLTFGFSGSNYRLAGTLAIASGGTGATTVAGARVNLLPSYTGNGGKVLALNSGATDLEWLSVAGAGTVTSVDVSGGTTGLTTSGGPITAAGTITIGGTLAPTSGGTGITSFAVGDLLFANTTTTLDTLHVGTNGYLLASNGTAPAYVDPASVTVGSATTATTATSATSATTATNLAGGAGGSIPYQSIAGTTTFLASGTGVLAASGGNPAYTMTPSLTQVTVAADPTLALQVATKQYVDTIATTSVHYHTPVKYEVPNTTGNLTATYNNGASGVGATLTNAGTLGAFTPDGIVASVNDRILIYNQTNAYENGVYTVTTVGNGSTPWVLTRATDANTYDPISPNSLGGGDAFFVTSGVTGAGETYVCNNVGPITFGTTAITFVQVSATQVYSAGTGLTLTGTTFSLTSPVATSLGGTGLSSFTSGGAVYATSTSALTTGTLPVTAGGTGATSLTSGYLVKGNGTSAASASVVYDDGTNVGIGTASPNAPLTFASSTGRKVGFYQGTQGYSIGVESSEFRFVTDSSAIFSWRNGSTYSSSTEYMRLDANGNLLVGTAAAVDNNFPLELNAGSSALRGMGVNNNGGYGVYLTYDNTGRYSTNGAAIRNIANSPLYFETNNTLRATLDASGNLGLGVTPSVGYGREFSISGDTVSGVAGLGVRNIAANNNWVYLQNNAKNTGAFTDAYWTSAPASKYAQNQGIHYWYTAPSGTAGNAITFTQAMTLDASGNLGLGTSSPDTRLTVAVSDDDTATRLKAATGMVRFRPYVGSASGAVIDATNAAENAYGAMSLLASTLRLLGNNGTGATIDASGNLLVGTTAVGAKLTVGCNTVNGDGLYTFNSQNSSYYTLYANGSTGNGISGWADSTVLEAVPAGSGGLVLGAYSGNMIFQTGARTERMRIDSSGNVGIGTGTPGYRLDVSQSGSSGAVIDVARVFANAGSTATPRLLFGSFANEVSAAIGAQTTSATAGDLTFYTETGGSLSEKMRLDSNGNLGIGTASPGGSANDRSVLASGSSSAVFQTNGGSVTTQFGSTSAGWGLVNVTTNNPLLLSTNNTERMRITSAGSVGIGTTSPARLFEVVASGTNIPARLGNSQGNLDIGGSDGVTVNIDTRSWAMGLQTGGTERMRITTGGDVGIGTSSPATKLDVNGQVISGNITVRGDGSEGGQVSLNNAANSAATYFFDVDVDGHGRIFTVTNNTNLTLGQLGGTGGLIALNTSGTERMRVDSGGNVNIGAQGATGAGGIRYFDIYNTENTSGSSGADIRLITQNAAGSGTTTVDLIKYKSGAFYIANAETGSGGIIGFNTSSTERMRIDSSGNVGIGTTTLNGGLTVNNPVNTKPVIYFTSNTSGAYPTAQATTGSIDNNFSGGAGEVSFWNNQTTATTAFVFRQQTGASSRTDVLSIGSTGSVTSPNLADAVGYKGLPQNSQTGAYTLALTDQGKHISITTGGVVIPANASVAFPVGSAIAIYNNSGSNQTISITSDTLRQAGTANTGSRTLAQYGVATIVKVASTVWVISGAGVS